MLRWFFLLSLFMGSAALLLALDDQPFAFSWKPVAGAGAYKIEIADLDGNVILTQTVEETQFRIKLYPSRYSLRLTTLNRFQLPEASTAWKSFSVKGDKPPVFGTLDQTSLVWGEPKILQVAGADFAGNMEIEFVDGEGRHFPLKSHPVDKNHFRAETPEELEPGRYTLVLTNVPLAPAEVPRLFRVVSPQPLVYTVDPKEFRRDAVPEEMTIRGIRFMKKAQVNLRSEGKVYPLKVLSVAQTQIKVACPPDMNVGDYQVEVVNESDVESGFTQLKVNGELTPQIAQVSRLRLRNSHLPLVLVIQGKDFSPQARIVLKKIGGGEAGKAVNLEPALKYVSSGELRISLDHEMDLGGWELTLVNQPGKPEVRGPELQVLENLLSRPVELNVAYQPALALGSWGDIYQYTWAGASLGVRYFFTEHRRPDEGEVWDWGIDLAVQGAWYPKSSHPSYLESSFWDVSLALGPVVKLSFTDWALSLAVRGGAAFSDEEAIFDDVSQEPLVEQNIDPYLYGELGVEIPFSDLVRLEVGAFYRRIWFTEAFDSFGTTLRVNFALPTHPEHRP